MVPIDSAVTHLRLRGTVPFPDFSCSSLLRAIFIACKLSTDAIGTTWKLLISCNQKHICVGNRCSPAYSLECSNSLVLARVFGVFPRLPPDRRNLIRVGAGSRVWSRPKPIVREFHLRVRGYSRGVYYHFRLLSLICIRADNRLWDSSMTTRH